MKKRILKKSEVLREGYIKGLKKAQRLIKESLENPFEDTEEWYMLSSDERKLVSAYLDNFSEEETLAETLESARDKFVGFYDDWSDLAYHLYKNGNITAEMLVDDYDCVDWDKAGSIFESDYYMSNGIVFES